MKAGLTPDLRGWFAQLRLASRFGLRYVVQASVRRILSGSGGPLVGPRKPLVGFRLRQVGSTRISCAESAAAVKVRGEWMLAPVVSADKVNGGSVVVFDPAKSRVKDAQADAVIAYAKRVHDWPMLAAAIDQKLEDQRAFVEWWDGAVRGDGRPKKTISNRKWFSQSDAEGHSGITAVQVSRWRKRLEKPEEYKAALYGAAWSKAMGASAEPGDVHYSSETPEWYTPEKIIAATVELMGGIDLDPCSNSREKPNVPATNHFTQEDDGLTCDWAGRIYMNPPYGDVISLWAEKLVAEYRAKRTTEAVALVPARVDTGWFELFGEFAVCFIRGRLKFSGSENSAPFPSAVIYLGENIEGFRQTFRKYGRIWMSLQD